ncbi:MAG: PHP domain-containing protein [Candidatus Margulisbacteria bacterium]|nr:PHP domain-containing protein [Candidatus Margulisiibacteriota bacterium]MBU1021388.1 PHP domain-containing protein [Candidatus Margulisiibacteriota bacterium]MBU1729123.1 PHP domain-containing protein [Candidatus Margulisiibacteriota bacterium]MBU1954796.1 PHP domain-containing protein [Candidatus Margulisiibacteriota bacterium]
MAADLHIHTTCSDGTYTPEQIIKVAKKVGLKTVAITDHDTTAGLAEALTASAKMGVTVIPGIEFTSETSELEVHILAYFMDYNNPELLAILEKLRNARKDRIYKITDKLKDLGVRIKAREVIREARGGCPGRPHVARVLIKEGFCKNFREAFSKYLAFGGPAYVGHYKLTPQDTVKIIRQAKGIPALAHPGGFARNKQEEQIDKLIPELVEAGLLGIEALYPTHTQKQTEHFLQLTKQYNLLATGGSDFHGDSGVREVIFGEFTLADSYVDALTQKAKELH